MDHIDLSKSSILTFALFVFGCVLSGFLIGCLMFSHNGETSIKKQAIENQCARYNPTTGDFEWVKHD